MAHPSGRKRPVIAGRVEPSDRGSLPGRESRLRKTIERNKVPSILPVRRFYCVGEGLASRRQFVAEAFVLRFQLEHLANPFEVESRIRQLGDAVDSSRA